MSLFDIPDPRGNRQTGLFLSAWLGCSSQMFMWQSMRTPPQIARWLHPGCFIVRSMPPSKWHRYTSDTHVFAVYTSYTRFAFAHENVRYIIQSAGRGEDHEAGRCKRISPSKNTNWRSQMMFLWCNHKKKSHIDERNERLLESFEAVLFSKEEKC